MEKPVLALRRRAANHRQHRLTREGNAASVYAACLTATAQGALGAELQRFLKRRAAAWVRRYPGQLVGVGVGHLLEIVQVPGEIM